MKKIRSIKISCLLLMTVFLLIRLIPFYYTFRAMPMQRVCRDKKLSVNQATASRQLLLVKSDRLIVEDIDRLTVPAIKFAGIPFVFFLLITIGATIGIKHSPPARATMFANADLNQQRVLRL